MKILNLGCGADRPGEPFVNLDDLHSQFKPDAPERIALDAEPNYVNFIVGTAPLPFANDTFDSVFASHFFEHFSAPEAASIMSDCRRILKPGGVLLVSVPDASYFRRVYPRDCNKNWPELFDVRDPKNPIPTWFDAALWFDQHKVILTEDALWCYFIRAGFSQAPVDPDNEAMQLMTARLNRRKFSLEMAGVKS